MATITLDEIIEYRPPVAKPPLPPIAAKCCLSSAERVDAANPAPAWSHLGILYAAQPALLDVPYVSSRSSGDINNAPVPDRSSGELPVSMGMNAFDSELAKWDVVEIVDMTADTTDSHVSQQGGDGCVDEAERQSLEAIWLGKSASRRHSWSIFQAEKRALTWWSGDRRYREYEDHTHIVYDITENPVQQAARLQTSEAAGPDPSLAVTGPTGAMCARTGNGPEGLSLRQDPAPRTDEAEETRSPTLCEGTQGVIPEVPTCNAPTNDESFQPPLDCSAREVALHHQRVCGPTALHP
jgi:hypothetical protein